MECAGGLLGLDDQEPAFCVDDLFATPSTADDDEDVDFVTSWIETAIDEPESSLPTPSESLPYLDLNARETEAPTDPLSPLDFFSNESPDKHEPDTQGPADIAKQERVEDEIQPNPMPAPIPGRSSRLPVRGQTANIPLYEIRNSAGIATTAAQTPVHPQFGYRTLPRESFPYRARVGDAGLQNNACHDNCECHHMTTPPRAPQIQAGTPLTTSTLSPIPGRGYNAVIPTRSLMPPPPLAMRGVPDFQLNTPEYSTLTAYTNPMTLAAPQNVVYRVPSASSGASFVTQASLQMAAPEATQGTTKAKNRYSKGASASNYCHVCGRNSRIEFAVCANTKVGLCRKVVCDKCLLLYERESFETSKDPRVQWKCTHCRNVCPSRARCKQYTRNNHRRRARKAEAALTEARHRQLASQAADQNLHMAQQAQPNQPVPSTPPVQPSQPVKQTRQTTPKSRRKGQQKPPKRQQAKRSPQHLPKVHAVAQQPTQWALEDDLPLVASPRIERSLGSLADPSSQHNTGQAAQLLMERVFSSPGPGTPPVRGLKREYSHVTESPNLVGTQLCAQMPGVTAGLQIQYGGAAVGQNINGIRMDEVVGEAAVADRSGKRRRLAEPFVDGISPVSIANMMMSGNNNAGLFADNGL